MARLYWDFMTRYILKGQNHKIFVYTFCVRSTYTESETDPSSAIQSVRMHYATG